MRSTKIILTEGRTITLGPRAPKSRKNQQHPDSEERKEEEKDSIGEGD